MYEVSGIPQRKDLFLVTGFREKKIDIVCLQETFTTGEILLPLKKKKRLP